MLFVTVMAAGSGFGDDGSGRIEVSSSGRQVRVVSAKEFTWIVMVVSSTLDVFAIPTVNAVHIPVSN